MKEADKTAGAETCLAASAAARVSRLQRNGWLRGLGS
jgi:hypothetical protein